jgi:hypothetical protein
VKKKYLDGLGTFVDGLRRAKLRFDDVFRRQVIARVQRLVFVLGRAVGGKAAEGNLKSRSWTAVKVCDNSSCTLGVALLTVFT